jgi:hypothetical protein
MPNTPCLVSETAAAFALGTHATEDDRQLVQVYSNKQAIISANICSVLVLVSLTIANIHTYAVVLFCLHQLLTLYNRN